MGMLFKRYPQRTGHFLTNRLRRRRRPRWKKGKDLENGHGKTKESFNAFQSFFSVVFGS
ncbi:Protein CBG26486 [Caenorhabditis briggsae]|uniref:Protein CBG26486 n=1 Tax=Caenorhabditis briggsae TaxID=6238 RepID=B6IH37_CAEBR|nr:Protein CBG26486 [Caenorhabditis briggsae]CAR99217.1 Protein CBG26486 [Caenorhabditis briggsae]